MMSSLLNKHVIKNDGSFFTRLRKKPFQSIIFFLVLVNVTLAAINIGIWFMAWHQDLFVTADYTSFYTGYYMVRVGEGRNLYDPNLQGQYQQLFMGGLSFKGGVLLFPNPPFVAILLSPLSLLSLRLSFFVWTFIQLVLLLWLILSLKKLFSAWSKNEFTILVITILSFWPLVNTFLLGQFSLLLTIGFLQIYKALLDGRKTAGGFWFSLIAIKPHLLLIPGVLTLTKRNWRMAIGAALAGVMIFILSILILGVKPWSDYIHNLSTMSTFFGEYGVTPGSEYSLRGLLSNILGNGHSNLTNLVSLILLVVGMVGVWLLWMKFDREGSATKLYFSLTVMICALLSLHMNPHDTFILVLPAAIFYDHLREYGLPRRVYSVLLMISPLVFFTSAFSNYNLLAVVRPPMIVILVMLVWMVVYLYSYHRSTNEMNRVHSS